MSDTHRTGYIYKPTPRSAWVHGDNKTTVRFGSATLMPGGHGWGKYIPASERQSSDTVEPCDCTVIHQLRAWITLSNFYGFKLPPNAAERFNAIMAHVRPPGANPNDVAESIRTWGVIADDALPFNDHIRSVADFYSPDPMDEMLIAEAKKVVQQYELGHNILFNDSPLQTTPNKPAIIKSALERGPVCVSLYAWNEPDAFQVYHKLPGQVDEHWILIEDYVDGKYWIVSDSYEPFKKKVAWDTDFQCAKGYVLQPNTTGIAPNDRTYLSSLLRFWTETLQRWELKLKIS